MAYPQVRCHCNNLSATIGKSNPYTIHYHTIQPQSLSMVTWSVAASGAGVDWSAKSTVPQNEYIDPYTRHKAVSATYTMGRSGCARLKVSRTRVGYSCLNRWNDCGHEQCIMYLHDCCGVLEAPSHFMHRLHPIVSSLDDLPRHNILQDAKR